MTDHTPLYEIAQKIFNAGQQYQHDADVDFLLPNPKLPAAFPIITPLVDELVRCVEEQVRIEHEGCVVDAEEVAMDLHRDGEIEKSLGADAVADYLRIHVR